MNLSKRKLGIYSTIGRSKMRKKYGLFIVEGEKGVADTLSHFELEALVVESDYDCALMVPDEKRFCAESKDIAQISSLTTPPKVLAVYKIPEIDGECVAPKATELSLLLDGVQDPGNMGTIIRTCHWFGIKKIFASYDCVDVYNPKTVQATMGSLGKVEVYYCDLCKLIDENSGLPVYGLMLDGEDIFHAKLEKSGLIVMGNEGNGISEAVRNKITQALLIPPGSDDHGESLNVAIATAITIAEFCRH